MVLVRKMRLLGETKSAQIWFQNVRLDVIKKTSTHTWWFHSQTVIGILMRRNMCFSAAIVIERLTDSTRTRINVAHSRNYRRVMVRTFNLRPMEVLHGKFMWSIIIINICNLIPSSLNLHCRLNRIRSLRKQMFWSVVFVVMALTMFKQILLNLNTLKHFKVVNAYKWQKQNI